MPLASAQAQANLACPRRFWPDWDKKINFVHSGLRNKLHAGSATRRYGVHQSMKKTTEDIGTPVVEDFVAPAHFC
jgi:hypothetical protein